MKQLRNEKMEETTWRQVVIACVKGLCKAVDRVLRKYQMTTAMILHCTIREMLVHLKDKCEILESSQCIHEIACIDCSLRCICETGI